MCAYSSSASKLPGSKGRQITASKLHPSATAGAGYAETGTSELCCFIAAGHSGSETNEDAVYTSVCPVKGWRVPDG